MLASTIMAILMKKRLSKAATVLFLFCANTGLMTAPSTARGNAPRCESVFQPQTPLSFPNRLDAVMTRLGLTELEISPSYSIRARSIDFLARLMGGRAGPQYTPFLVQLYVESLMRIPKSQREQLMAWALEPVSKSIREKKLRTYFEAEMAYRMTLNELRTTGELRSQTVIEDWSQHFYRVGGFQISRDLIANALMFQYVPGTQWTSLWLPSLTLKRWKELPPELVERAVSEGVESIWPDFKKNFSDADAADIAWSRFRFVYNAVTVAIFLDFLLENKDLLLFAIYSMFVTEKSIQQEIKNTPIDQRVDLQLRQWLDAYQIKYGQSPSNEEVAKKRIWIHSVLTNASSQEGNPR